MKRDFEEKWNKTREKGRSIYILKYGMLMYGLPLGLIGALIARYFENGFSFVGFFYYGLVGDIIARGLFTMVFAGGVFGYLMWKSNEEKYLKEVSMRARSRLK
ncbi:hypothetical protein [Paenibacillus sp.]|uniref:hypothetical protein n=1 Tax=Paenibacillus sp. TaxID=58172 RepID=UPI002D250761|nr:hypothetical protein [Paenibacillus sp.]HZG86691.1 hypothetical protein [Paenibacillus sp.]